MATQPLAQQVQVNDAPHFADAPIVEALLNLRTPPLPAAALDAARTEFAKAVEGEYPIVQSLGVVALTGTFSGGSGVSAAAQQQQTGFIFRSADGRHALQARLDGFAYSQFAPYDRWESFRDNARRFWDLYRAHVSDAEPNAIGVRTINALPIPTGAELERYVKIYPALPEQRAFPQVLQNFMLRLQLPVEDGVLIVQSGYLQPTAENIVNILLDLDFTFPRRLDVDLWDQVDGLRATKDRIFMDSITEEMKEILHARGG